MGVSTKKYPDPRTHPMLNDQILTSVLRRLGARDNSPNTLLYGDMTTKYDMKVEGRIHGSIESAVEAQDFHVWKTLTVQDDATVKGHVRMEYPGTVFTSNIRSRDLGLWLRTEGSALPIYLVGSQVLAIAGQVTLQGDIFLDGPLYYPMLVKNDATVKQDLRVERRSFFGGAFEALGKAGFGANPIQSIGLRTVFTADGSIGTGGGQGITAYVPIDGYSSDVYYKGIDGIYANVSFSPTYMKADLETLRGVYSLVSLSSNERFSYVGTMLGVLSRVQYTGDDSTVHTAVWYDTQSYNIASDFKLTGEQIGLRICDLQSVTTPASWAIWTGKDPLRLGGDATAKGQIYVEGEGKTFGGINVDATVDNWVVKAVNGVLVRFRRKSG